MKNKVFKFSNFVFLFFAGIINSIGVTMFLAPVHIYDSGFSGTSMLLWQLTPEKYTFSFFLLILNIPFFLYGYRKQGFVFTVYSIFAIVIYSLSSYVIADVLPVNVVDSSPFAGTDLLLCSIFGGLISGIGSGLTIRFGGAIDGVEVLAVIFAKKIGLTVGTFVMIYNSLLYIIAGFVLNTFILPLYSVITYAVAIKAVDFLVDGFDKAKSAMIITEKADEISKALSNAFETGVTQISSKGYYEGKNKTIIYFVVNRFQIGKMKEIVSSIDSSAFVTITEVADIMRKSVK